MPRLIVLHQRFRALHPIRQWWVIGLFITFFLPLVTWGLNLTAEYVPEQFQEVRITATAVIIVVYILLTAPIQVATYPLSYFANKIALGMDSVREFLTSKGYDGYVNSFEQVGEMGDVSTFIFNFTILRPDGKDLFPTLNTALYVVTAFILSSLLFCGIGWCFAHRGGKKWGGLLGIAAMYAVSLYYMVAFLAENREGLL